MVYGVCQLLASRAFNTSMADSKENAVNVIYGSFPEVCFFLFKTRNLIKTWFLNSYSIFSYFIGNRFLYECFVMIQDNREWGEIFNNTDT